MLTDFLIGPSILMYHSVDDHSDDPYSVSVNAFREQMSWLSENGFEVVPLSFLLQSIQARSYRQLRKKVVITFDDGYQDFLTNAMPTLLECKATATVFLVTGMLGRRASWKKSEKHEQLMTEDEVYSIKKRGISLGSHTSTHKNLTLLEDEDLQREIRDSYNALSRLGETFFVLSYPWGQWTHRVIYAVISAGYKCALAVGEKTRLNSANMHILPRIPMARAMNLKQFASMMKRTAMGREIRRTYGVLRIKADSGHGMSVR